MRSLTARLVAQRDAYCTLVLHELERAETDGRLLNNSDANVSLRGLQTEARRLAAQLAARVDECRTLGAALSSTQEALRVEKAGRKADVARLTCERRVLHGETSALEAQMAHTRYEQASELPLLRLELAYEESGRAANH